MNALSFIHSFHSSIHFSAIGQYATELLMIRQTHFSSVFQTTLYRWWQLRGPMNPNTIFDVLLRFETRAAQRRLGSKCRSNLLNVSPGGLGKMSESQFQDQLRT